MNDRRSPRIQHCKIESLETRSLRTAVALNTHFNAAMPAALSKLQSYATDGVALPDGRFLAVGVAIDANQQRNVYVMYKPNGSLDASFGHGGVAIQSIERTAQLGVAGPLVALPNDRGVLIQLSDGLHRLTTSGDFDTTYGGSRTGGVVGANISSFKQQADGTIIAIENAGNGFHTRTFNAQGDPLRYSAITVKGGGKFLSDGRIATARAVKVGTASDLAISLYTPGLHAISTFAGGTLDLTKLMNNWFAKHGPWYNQQGKKITPYLYAGGITATNDGGIVVDASLLASRSKPTAAQTAGDPIITNLRIHLSATGQLISTTGDDNRTGFTFFGSYKNFSGAFHFGHGQDATFSLPAPRGYIIKTVPTATGDYILGQTYASATKGLGKFTVVLTQPPAGTISGTLFNDRNSNGVFNAGESINAGKTVYIDSNNNGVLDTGEETATTDAKGHFAFSDLGSGTYQVRRVLPKGYRQTTSSTAITVSPSIKRTFNIGSVTKVAA